MKNKLENRKAYSINDELKERTCTDNYYKMFADIVCTDGVKELVELGQCYWMLSEVAFKTIELQKKQKEYEYDFLVFTLKRVKGSRFKISISDGNKVFESKDIPFSDFEYDEATIWVENNVMLLPSEH